MSSMRKRAREPARLDVLRQHARREFQRDHAGRLVAVQRHRLAFPGRPRKRQHGEGPGKRAEQQRRTRAGRRHAFHQVLQQVLIDHRAPGAAVAAPAPPQQPAGQRQRQQQQDPRAQEMEIGEQRAHAGTPRRQRQPGSRKASAAAASAPPSGNQ
jgi:hypothetical protein